MRKSKTPVMDYQRQFLAAHKLTREEFAVIHRQFTKATPVTDVEKYKLFARRWKIAIIPDGTLPYHTQVVMSVQIACAKVLATHEDEVKQALTQVMASFDWKQ